MVSDLARSSGPEHDAPVAPAEVVPWGGLPAPVVLALVLAASVAAQWLDLRLFDGVGALLSTVFLVGSVSAVVAVRRRGVVLVMIATPLVLVVAVVIMETVISRQHTDTTGVLMAVAQPMVLHFPVLAGTTALVLLAGSIRLARARPAVRTGPSSDRI